jgi:SAM-dependent methyltransferase
MTGDSFYSPRHESPVDYALSITKGNLELLRQRNLALEGRSVLEIGPGSEFACALVFVSCGAKVTIADRYLAAWDDSFHPGFYREFLRRWDGPRAAIEGVLASGGYQDHLHLLHEPAKNLSGVTRESIDLVLSNAVLEHVYDLGQAVRELSRIMRPGGVQTHQVDCRDHRDFGRPLDHLLMPSAQFEALRRKNGCIHGTQMRLQEIIECFTPYFWIDEVEPNGYADPSYLNWLTSHSGGRLTRFSSPSLRITSGRFWATRKPGKSRHRAKSQPSISWHSLQRAWSNVWGRTVY